MTSAHVRPAHAKELGKTKSSSKQPEGKRSVHKKLRSLSLPQAPVMRPPPAPLPRTSQPNQCPTSPIANAGAPTPPSSSRSSVSNNPNSKSDLSVLSSWRQCITAASHFLLDWIAWSSGCGPAGIFHQSLWKTTCALGAKKNSKYMVDLSLNLYRASGSRACD